MIGAAVERAPASTGRPRSRPRRRRARRRRSRRRAAVSTSRAAADPQLRPPRGRGGRTRSRPRPAGPGGRCRAGRREAVGERGLGRAQLGALEEVGAAPGTRRRGSSARAGRRRAAGRRGRRAARSRAERRGSARATPRRGRRARRRAGAGRRRSCARTRPRRSPRARRATTRAPPSARNAASAQPTIPPPMTATSGAHAQFALRRREVLGRVHARDERSGRDLERAGAPGARACARSERLGAPAPRAAPAAARVVAARERLVLATATPGRRGRRARASSSARHPRLVARDGDDRAALERGDQARAAGAAARGLDPERRRRAAAARVSGFATTTASSPAARAAASGRAISGSPPSAPSPSRRPCGARARRPAPRRSRADGVRAQQLAQLDLQLQRRERRREPLVGAGRARVAARALVDHQQHLRVARQRVGAQRADDLGGAEDDEVRPRVARRVQRARAGASRTSTRPPSATRAIARVVASTPGEQARASGARRGSPSIAARTSTAACAAAGSSPTAGRRRRPPRAPRSSCSPQDCVAALGRLVERLARSRRRSRPGGPGARATAAAAARTGARRSRRRRCRARTAVRPVRQW